MFWKRAQQRASESRMRNQALRDRHTKMVADAGFEMVHYENAMSFGNIVLDISRGTMLLRFVRDRGFASCEVKSILMPKAEGWVDYNPLARMMGLPQIGPFDDFDELLANTIDPSNAQAIKALERLTQSKEQYARISHQAICLIRKNSPFRE